MILTSAFVEEEFRAELHPLIRQMKIAETRNGKNVLTPLATKVKNERSFGNLLKEAAGFDKISNQNSSPETVEIDWMGLRWC